MRKTQPVKQLKLEGWRAWSVGGPAGLGSIQLVSRRGCSESLGRTFGHVQWTAEFRAMVMLDQRTLQQNLDVILQECHAY